MNETNLTYSVSLEHSGWRLDRYLAALPDGLSRTYLQKLIETGSVKVNQNKVKPNYRVNQGDKIECLLPEPDMPDICPENLPINILYEDDDVIVVNKEKDMVVHPAAGHYSGTLVNALLFHCGNSLSGINGITRPGIVHRIDKDTTGVLIACKNDSAHKCISEQLKAHSINRIYEALVYGAIKEDSGRIVAPIGRHPTDRKKMAVNEKNGKEAITNYSVIERLGGKYSYIRCKLETGRTHQIRVHLSSIHHPLIGDPVYGIQPDHFQLQGQALHARILGFQHPSTGEYMEFEAELPQYFIELLEKLKR